MENASILQELNQKTLQIEEKKSVTHLGSPIGF